MSLYEASESECSIQGQEMNMTLKDESKEDNESEEIIMLTEKINEMEKNYIHMERYYSEKLKNLQKKLIDKDQ